MCAKPEPASYLQPIADLQEEFVNDWGQGHLLPTLSWAGVSTFYAVLENV